MTKLVPAFCCTSCSIYASTYFHTSSSSSSSSSFSFIVCLVIVHASTGQTFSPPHECLLAAAVANFALVMPFDQQLAQRVETLESSSMTSRHVCTQCFYRDTITVPPHSSFTTNGFKDEMGVLAFTP